MNGKESQDLFKTGKRLGGEIKFLVNLIQQIKIFFRVNGQANVFAFELSRGGNFLQMKSIGMIVKIGSDMLQVN